MKTVTLTPLAAIAAEQIHKAIQEQVTFIAKQEKTVTSSLLGPSLNGYDLRQNVQALETGKNSMSALKSAFQSYVGVPYDDYCESINIDKVVTPEERLLNAIKEMVNKSVDQAHSLGE